MFKKNKVYIIAEIGGNHEGDFNKARELLHQAVDAGVDAVKYQVYSGNTLVNIREDPVRVRHFDRFALTVEQYEQLAIECNERGVNFCASVWNESLINSFAKYMAFVKVGSGDLTAYLMLERIAMLNKPIVLSTGLATLDEVRSAVEYLRTVNGIYKRPEMLVIMQCTSMYPIPDRDANLSVITTLKREFPYEIGYSDHTESTYAAEIAVALGASVLEVHFTDNRESARFRDHLVSFTKEDIIELRKKIGIVKQLLGDGVKRPMRSEIENGHLKSFRRALYPRHSISRGQKVLQDDLIALRPEHGIPASRSSQIVGKNATRDLVELEVLCEEDFE